jgi:hypothetical protein
VQDKGNQSNRAVSAVSLSLCLAVSLSGLLTS